MKIWAVANKDDEIPFHDCLYLSPEAAEKRRQNMFMPSFYIIVELEVEE